MGGMDDEGGGDGFATSWGDLITLLMVFFVYLFSISEIEEIRFIEAATSVRNEIKLREKNELAGKLKEEKKLLRQMKEQIDTYVQSAKLEQVIDAVLFPDRLEISLGSMFLFQVGSATLREAAYPILNRLADMAVNGSTKIVVEGHTDSIPISTIRYPSNWELSSARASSVARAFIERGVNGERFVVMGLSEFDPVGPNKTEAMRQKNRRVKIIMRPSVDLMKLKLRT